MTKILFILIFFYNTVISAYDDVYSETNAYNIHQVNSNNTYNDNSKILSDNSFALFGGWGNDYSNYMNNEPLLYLSTYVTGTFGGITQGAVGGQLGIYEDIYLVGEYGVYSAPEDSPTIGDKATDGTFINYGISYHTKIDTDTLMTFEVIYRKMLTQTYSNGRYSFIDGESDRSQGFLMINGVFFKSNGHTGVELGMGFGEDLFVFKAGLKFRYF